MKRWLLLLILLIATPCYPAGPEIFMGGASAAAVLTARDYVTGTTDANGGLCQVTDKIYLGGWNFVAAGSYTITQIKLPLWKTNSPTCNMYAAIYDDSTNVPNALVGTASSAVAANTVVPTADPGDTEGDWTTFSNVSATLTATNVYHVVLYGGSGCNSSNFVNWVTHAKGGTPTPYVYKSATSPPATQDGSYSEYKFRLFGP